MCPRNWVSTWVISIALLAFGVELQAARPMKRDEAIRLIRQELNIAYKKSVEVCAVINRAPVSLTEAGYVVPATIQDLLRAEIQRPEVAGLSMGNCQFKIIFQANHQAPLQGERYSIDSRGVIQGMTQFGSMEEIMVMPHP